MRKGVLVALCGGALMFAYGAYKEGSRWEALAMFLIVMVVMVLMLWVDYKDKHRK